MFIYAVTGLNPIKVYVAMFDGALGSKRKIGFTIRDTIRTRIQIRDLDKKIAHYEAKIERDSIFIDNITHDPEFMERYAREQYHMQRAGETVYILE